jgi:hypothetical protein
MPSTGHQRSVEEIATRVANNRLLAKSRHDNSTLPLTIEKSGHDETARSEISPTILTSSAVPDSDDHPSSADIVYFGKPNPTEGSNFGSRPKLAPNSSIDQYCTCPVVQETKAAISPILYDYIDTNEAASLPRSDLEAHLTPVLTTILSDLRINLAGPERRGLLDCIVDDMLGYGPLQPLINDPSVSEILVNRPDQVFVERNGTLIPTSIE